MEYEKQKPKEPEKKPVEEGEKKPISIVDEARGLRDDIRKEKELLIEERKKLEEARANEVLSSSAGGHIEVKKPKEETDEEYVQKFKDGEVNPLRENA